ncbi:uncharacterized protein LOC135848237 [Planococcus citri]|uniref:uncharacterized protein LOC135848237 n=1 Tax=Planococcus citri TaxID=170843 RepID=UPI0031F7633B
MSNQTKPKCSSWSEYNEVTIDNKTKYQCKFCGKTYAPHATRLRAHLLECTKKPENTSQNSFDADIINANSTSSVESKGSLKRFCDLMSTGENEILSDMMSKAIIVSGCSFRMFDHDLWKEFFNRIRPSFKIPPRKAIAKQHLEKHYEEMICNVNEKLKNSDNFHLQCDGWSNIRNEGIINFMICLPEPVYIKFVATGSERHTADYIRSEIEKILLEYGPAKFTTIIGDNAKNFQKALNDIKLKYPHITPLRCTAHTLNLLCEDIMQMGPIKAFFENTNQIINHIRKSQVLNSMLKRRLKLYVKTRWGTIENSLTSLLDSKFELQSLAINPNASMMKKSVQDDLLSADFWTNVQCLREVLLPITSLIVKIEGDGLYMHTINEEMKTLEHTFNEKLSAASTSAPIFKSADDSMCQSLKAKFIARKEWMVQPIHYAAVLLNPNDMGKSLSPGELMQGMEFISEFAAQRNIIEATDAYNGAVNELADYRSKANAFKHDFLWKAAVDSKMDILSWWRGLCGHTSLSKIAVSILTAAVTSAATERSFSTFSFIHSKKRNRLSTETASKKPLLRRIRRMAKNVAVIHSDEALV